MLAAALVAGSLSAVSAQQVRGVVGSLAVEAGGVGELVVSWVAPADPAVQPTDYRLDWAVEGEPFTSWRVDEGHLYPSGELTEVTISGLEPGGSYSVRLRARYHSAQFGRSPWSGPWTQTADAVQAGAAAESQAEPGAEGEAGTDAEGRSDAESGSEPKSETESSAESDDVGDAGSDAEGESDSDAEAESGVALGGVLGLGVGSYGGSPFVGYTYWTGVGSFEWSVGELGSVYVKSLVWLRGEVSLRGRGGLVDPVLLTAQGPVGSPFVLTVGDAVFASADAVVPAGEANTQTHYWIWDRACPKWAVGDEAALTLRTGETPGADEVGLSLGSLSVAGAVLRDGFDPAAADHVADADIGTATVTVEATAADSRACGVDISPADADPDTDGHQLKLAADGAVATVTVTAPGGNAATHTLTVTRGSRAPAALTGLDVDGAPEVEFDPAQRRYETTTDAASVLIDAAGADDALIDITAVRSDQPASVDEAAEGTVQLASGGDTTVVMRVTTPDAQSESVYTMRLHRSDPAGNPAPARADTPAPVSTRGHSATPAPATFSAFGRTQTAVPATVSTRGQTQTAFPTSFGSGGRFSPDGTVPDAVYASKNGDAETDGPTTRSDPDPPQLTGLAVNPGPLAPGFDAAVFAYTAAVDNTVTHMTVTPQVPTGATAAITPADADADTPGHQIALNAIADGNTSSQTAIAFVVTAGTQQQTYTVTVTRAAPLGQVTMELPDHCVLHDLGAGNETASFGMRIAQEQEDNCRSLHLMRFKMRNAEYFRLVLHDEGEVRLEVRGSHSAQLLIRSSSGESLAHSGEIPRYTGQPDHPGNARLTRTLPRGTYVVEMATQWFAWWHRQYVMDYYGDTIVRTDAYELTGLDITDVNMAGFSTEVFDYARNVAADISAVTVAADASLPDAQIEILPADSDTSTAAHEVALVPGGTTEITVAVSSPLVDDSEKIYRFALTQLAGTAAPLSDDASLSSLSFVGLDIGTFSSDVTDYTFPLSLHERLRGTSTTVTATTAHGGATWAVNGEDHDLDADGHQIAVTGAADERLVVTATSQDGAIKRSYTATPRPPLTEKSPTRRITLPYGMRTLWSDGETLTTVNYFDLDPRFAVYDVETLDRTETIAVAGPPYEPGVSYFSWASGNAHVMGFWSDGETLWVLYRETDDSLLGHENNLLYAYSAATGERQPDKDIELPDFDAIYKSFWTDGRDLYLLTGWDRIFVFDFAVGERLDHDDLREELIQQGVDPDWRNRWNDGRFMWSDGTTLWIVQHHDNHPGFVRAHDLKTGVRVPGLDIYVHELGITRDARPAGMWSDGRTAWLLGNTPYANSWLRAYTLPENARLSSLSLSDAEMDLFYNGKFAYDAVVPAGTTSVTVAATAAFSGGSSSVVISPADADAVTDGHQVALSADSATVVTVTVTAPNGTDTETYTVSVTVAED